MSWNYSYITWDDPLNFGTNSHLNRPNGPDFAYFWLHTYTLTYRPIIWTIWSLIAQFSRVGPHHDPAIGWCYYSPHGFHIANIVFHAIDAVLAYVLLRMLFRRTIPAAAGALLFAVHPLQDETVCWITGGNVAFFGIFLFLTLIHYVRYADLSGSKAPSKAARGHYTAACFWLVCAAFTYPLTVAVPIVAWIIDRMVIGRPARTASIVLAPWAAFGLLLVVITASAKHLSKAVVHVAPGAKPLVACDSIAFYLYKYLLPINLTLDYGRTPDYVTGHAWVWATAASAVLFLFCLWKVRERWPVAAAGGAIFVAGLLPTIGLVTNPMQLYSTVADRYAYVSLFGPAMVLAWALSWVSARRINALLAGWFAVIAALFGLTFVHVQHFRNDDTLFPYALKENPNSWGLPLDYGIYLNNLNRNDEAQTYLERSLSLMPDLPQSNSIMADLLEGKGNNEGAIVYLQRAIEYTHPPDFKLYDRLGRQFSDLNEYPKAVDAFTQAVNLRPTDEQAQAGLGIALGNVGQMPQAIAHLRLALSENPKDIVALDDLGLTLAETGQLPDAIAAWNQALAVDPNSETTHSGLAYAYEHENRLPEALQQYREVLRIDPTNAAAQSAVTRLETAVAPIR